MSLLVSRICASASAGLQAVPAKSDFHGPLPAASRRSCVPMARKTDSVQLDLRPLAPDSGQVFFDGKKTDGCKTA